MLDNNAILNCLALFPKCFFLIIIILGMFGNHSIYCLYMYTYPFECLHMTAICLYGC